MMRKFAFSSCLAIAFLGMPALSTTASAHDRTAEEIVKEIDAIKKPTLNQAKVSDRAYVQTYISEMQAADKKQGELTAELYKVDPTNAKLVKLMPLRWQSMVRTDSAKVVSEIDEVLASKKNPALETEAMFTKAQLPLMTGAGDAKTIVKNIDAFIAHAPKDPRAGDLLFASTRVIQDPAQQTEILNRVIKDYPESRSAGQAKGQIKKVEGVGKPFTLAFTDAIKGTEVSIKGLKGKVVVIDFWATWCGPCIAEMPKMKKLYAEFKDKGVEFIGVSLDQPEDKGGLTKLKEYVAKNEIAWPQYYQGNFWQSEFSSSWGINSIPALFVVDTEGNLASINGRGNLEKLIPELLAKGKTSPGAGGGN